MRIAKFTLFCFAVSTGVCGFGHESNSDDDVKLVRVSHTIKVCVLQTEIVWECEEDDNGNIENDIEECDWARIEYLVCFWVVHKVTLVYELESDETRRNRIVDFVDDYVRTATGKILHKCALVEFGFPIEDPPKAEDCTFMFEERNAFLRDEDLSDAYLQDKNNDGIDDMEDVGGTTWWNPGVPNTAYIEIDIREFEKNVYWDHLRSRDSVEAVGHERLHAHDVEPDGRDDRPHGEVYQARKDLVRIIGYPDISWERQWELTGIRDGWD